MKFICVSERFWTLNERFTPLLPPANEVAGRLCFYTCLWFCSQGGSLSGRHPPYGNERAARILLECILVVRFTMHLCLVLKKKVTTFEIQNKAISGHIIWYWCQRTLNESFGVIFRRICGILNARQLGQIGTTSSPKWDAPWTPYITWSQMGRSWTIPHRPWQPMGILESV